MLRAKSQEPTKNHQLNTLFHFIYKCLHIVDLFFGVVLTKFNESRNEYVGIYQEYGGKMERKKEFTEILQLDLFGNEMK